MTMGRGYMNTTFRHETLLILFSIFCDSIILNKEIYQEIKYKYI